MSSYEGVHQGVFLATLVSIEHLISLGSIFPQVLSHVGNVEQACLKTYKYSSNRSCHQYSGDNIALWGEYQFNEGHRLFSTYPGL
ncbi:hypothetical protein H5410_003986 [Solanum commersonii]|uniref:Uncharacterized protein n=1 Tax=Solanum commersonii TaxID=4109 RepID=A0A9J6B658_SOLCO|nr:hypothetical protein H5410_003986 [Solanum commersonii]